MNSAGQTRPQRPRKDSRGWRLGLFFVLSGGLALVQAAVDPAVASLSDAKAAPPQPDPDQAIVRAAFSKSQFVGVNRNDALAALKVYTQRIGVLTRFATNDDQLILESRDALIRAIQQKQVEILSLTTEEFLAVEAYGVTGPLLVSTSRQQFTEEYVLLVRDESPILEVEDLQGRNLVISNNVRASLAQRWLDVLCLEHGMGDATKALAKITTAASPNLVILPVFFRHADACVATRENFETMGDLNPQVKKQLRIIARSVPLVPVLTCLRADLPESLKQRILTAAGSSQTQPAFAQVMALFKTDGLSQQPLSVLDTARALIATYQRLSKTATTEQPNPAPAR